MTEKGNLTDVTHKYKTFPVDPGKRKIIFTCNCLKQNFEITLEFNRICTVHLYIYITIFMNLKLMARTALEMKRLLIKTYLTKCVILCKR